MFSTDFKVSSAPLPLSDPTALVPSDHKRLAASNYILRQSIPLWYEGIIPQRARF